MPKFLYCVKNAKVCVDRYKALIMDPPTVFSLNPVCVWHSLKMVLLIANQAFRGYYLSSSALQCFPAVLWLKVEKAHEAGNWCLTCLWKVCICPIAFCLILENWMLQKRLIYIQQQPEVTSRVL